MVPPVDSGVSPGGGVTLPDGPGWVPRERAVLVFLFQGPDVLLIRKKRGLGAGKINGPGGRIDPGETAAEAAVRETREEVGLEPSGLIEAGQLCFQFTDGHGIHCTVYTGTQWRGNLTETDEADPFWHPVDAVPFDAMWADDQFWFPALLNGRYFRGYFTFHGDQLLDHRVDLAASMDGNVQVQGQSQPFEVGPAGEINRPHRSS